MPKLQTVTDAEVKDAQEAAFDLSQTLADIGKRMESGYGKDITKPIETARALVGLIASASDVVRSMLTQSALAEQKAELDALLRGRPAPEKKQ